MTLTYRVSLFIWALFLVLFCSTAQAQVAVDGGSGLLFVDKARTLGSGNRALGLTYQQAEWDMRQDRVKERTGTASFTAGIGERAEISISLLITELGFDDIDDVDGTGDGLLKLKYNVANSEKYNVRAAIMGLATIPVGDEEEGLGVGNVDLGVMFLLDKEYENITWHFNVGYMNRQEDGLTAQYLYAAGFEWFFRKDMGLIAEVTGHAWTAHRAWRDDNTRVATGIRWYFSDWGSMSVGYGSLTGGAGSESPNHLWLVGITIGRGLGAPEKGVGAGSFGPVSAVGAGAKDGTSTDKAGMTDDSGKAAEAATVTPVVKKPVIKIVLDSIHYKFDKSELTPLTKHILTRNAETLRKHPGGRLIVEGNTCSIGSDGYNMKLGLRRAKAARDFLAKELGIPVERMEMISYGESKPRNTNETKEGQALNRRVDFVIKSP